MSDEVVKIDVDETKKLTNWKNPPKVSELQNDVQGASSDHSSQVTKIDHWLDNLYVRGSAKITPRKGRSSIVPKLIRKQAEWRCSALSEPFLATEDLFDVSPVSWEDTKAANQNGLVLNNQFNTKIDKIKFINEYVRTAVYEGTVIARVGWKYETEINEVEKEIFNYEFARTEEEAALIQDIAQVAETDPTRFQQLPEELRTAYQISMDNGQPVIPIPTGTYETVEEETVLANHPTVEVCDYKNLIIDPTCKGDLEAARFVAYRFETSMAELEKAGRYSNLDKINVDNNSPIADAEYSTDSTSSFNFNDKPRKRLVAHEYWGSWDIHGDGKVVPIVATYVGNVMISLEENPFPDRKHPFVAAPYIPVKNSVYGEPDGELLEDNQKIIGAVTRGMVDIMARSANGQIGYRKDALDPTNKRKFLNNEDYEFNGNIPSPEQAFYVHKYPEIPASAQVMLQLQNSEAESLTGVKAFHNGISGQALGDTATGIRSALDAASKRELDILRRLAEGIKKIGRKIIAMNAEFLSDTEIVRVTNNEFISINKDDLAGNFDLKIGISTPESDEQKAQELAFMLQTTAQSMGTAFTQMILSEIARLRKMPELAKSIAEYQPQPDPLAQRKAELEIQLLEAEINYQNQRAQKEFADANLAMARVQTEGAKVGNLNADTDLKDLNFVEQETGTKQERELQKLDRQATQQAGLKALDARLKAIAGDSTTTTTNGLRSV